MLLYVISLLPPLLLLLALVWLDSFSLVNKWTLLSALGWGVIAAFIAILLSASMELFIISDTFAVPLVEELIKGLGALLVVRFRRSAFFIDSAIYGATIGMGFAILENYLYVHQLPDMLIGTAIVRGFGTAIMHCGTVASTTVLLNWFSSKRGWSLRAFPITLLPAILLHSFYNSLIVPPFTALVMILFGTTSWLICLFIYNERSISHWLDLELASEVELLSSMKAGEFSKSRAGIYMLTLRERFESECFFNMFCYVRLYLELSLASKRNLMLVEAGFAPIKDQGQKDKLQEFIALRKMIGSIGILALSPIVKNNLINQWKLRSLT